MIKENWWRIAIFVLLAGGAIYFLSSMVSSRDESLKETHSQVKGFSVEDFGESVEEKKETPLSGLQEKIDQVLPQIVKDQIEEIKTIINRESTKVIKETSETEIVKEVQQTIDQATEEVQGFPGKQTKEVKRQIIQQVCDQLLEDLEEE